MTHNYTSFTQYINDVKVQLLSKLEMTEDEAERYAETFGDYYEEGTPPDKAVETEIMYIMEDGVPREEDE